MSTDDASHREVLATQYNAFARAYQRNVNEEPLWRHSTTHTYRKLILRNGPLDNKTVLDIACGEGVLSRFCADSRAARVVGVDSSSEMIRLANDSVPETHAGALAFEMADGQVDLPNPEKFISVLRRSSCPRLECVFLNGCKTTRPLGERIVEGRDRAPPPLE